MNRTKLMAAAVSTVLSGALLLGGTMAWQSISQEATNIVASIVNPGGRLHDDFNGSNKDVYVENFADEELYARILIKEYLEVGIDAGRLNAEGRNVEVITKDVNGNPSDYENMDTWPIHRYSAEDSTSAYWTWELGGMTDYMPTFNMNKDSVKADINGTIEGENGLPYDDYIDWTAGDIATGTEVMDADTNSYDEYAYNEGAAGTNYLVYENVTHTAKSTAYAEVITMARWNELSAEEKTARDYWVVDTDGWAYYSRAIPPHSASGLLLSGITQTVKDHSFYYAIHVIAQFVTQDDVGTPEGEDGYFSEGEQPTEAALKLLREIGAITEETEEFYG